MTACQTAYKLSDNTMLGPVLFYLIRLPQNNIP